MAPLSAEKRASTPMSVRMPVRQPSPSPPSAARDRHRPCHRHRRRSSCLLPLAWLAAASPAGAYSSGEDCDDAMSSYGGGGSALIGTLGTLVAYSLLASLVGWAMVFHPFFFVPRFQAKVRGYVLLGNRRSGTVVSTRRGRVFNPLRHILPSRHNCYVTVEYDPRAPGAPGAGAAVIRKELVVDEQVLRQLLDRAEDAIDVYTAGPAYPYSGMLDDEYQGQRVGLQLRLAYGAGAAVLLALAYFLGFGATAGVLYSASGRRRVLPVVVLGHLLSICLAWWCCHFAYRRRIEALLYGTIDDGSAAYGRCGVASLDDHDHDHDHENQRGGGGGGGVGGGGGAAGVQMAALGIGDGGGTAGAEKAGTATHVEGGSPYHAMA